MTGTTTIEPRSSHATLLTWFSPAFPIGSFAHSHGLETAVAEGRIRDAGAVGDWIETLLLAGSGRSDLVLLAAGMRAAVQDEGEMASLSELALALSGSRERRSETSALGTAFALAARPWAETGCERPYPLAVARAAVRVELPAADVLLAYAHAFAAGLVSAAVRLVPLGQADAMGVMRRLEPVIVQASKRAEAGSLDDLGSCTLLSDIAAMRHETLATRLFRT